MQKMCHELDSKEYALILNKAQISDVADYCAFSKAERDGITALIVRIKDGMLHEIWTTTSPAPSRLYVTYTLWYA